MLGAWTLAALLAHGLHGASPLALRSPRWLAQRILATPTGPPWRRR